MHARPPAQGIELGHIEPLARRAVGLRGVESERAVIAHHLGDELGELGYRHVLAPADIDVTFAGIALHQENQRVGQIVDMEELCLLYTSPSPRDRQKSRMPSSA